MTCVLGTRGGIPPGPFEAATEMVPATEGLVAQAVMALARMPKASRWQTGSLEEDAKPRTLLRMSSSWGLLARGGRENERNDLVSIPRHNEAFNVQAQGRTFGQEDGVELRAHDGGDESEVSRLERRLLEFVVRSVRRYGERLEDLLNDRKDETVKHVEEVILLVVEMEPMRSVELHERTMRSKEEE
jgi:hypothetical protein